jgi:hypothetical protein
MSETLGVPGEKIMLSLTAYEEMRMRNEHSDLNRPRPRRKIAVKGEPSPRPWTFEITPSDKSAVVRGADGSLVCVCHPANARAMCETEVAK